MHDLLVATAEIDLDLVNASREESKPQPIPSGPASSAAVAAEDTAVASSAAVAAEDNEVIGTQGVEAMSWALKTDDQALVRSVCNALPSWCIKE